MLVSFVALAATAGAFVHPIEVRNAHFVDSITQEPFLIKGVDYQPGGSSGYLEWADPLSDVESCARDIFLFQKLGVNTIRVYTVNPTLNHDACMTMLASAGIYLVLDVNSPKVGESLNRYEPWTTYSPDYLQRIFQVVEQFSHYNNTLAFFMGNEIVNDERSASVSPPYIRAVTRDLKDYIRNNSPRMIPVGYSAADDLRYRIPLADYLTCGDDESAVDFYGVNSYQWCGVQTFQTSGYDLLVRDHERFTVPFFLSEFGCNIVQPRAFQEVEMLFSPAMTHVFSGGLVYEFTQEPNNYGLIELDVQGGAHLRPDFETLRSKLENVTADHTVIPVLSQPQPRQSCQKVYPVLAATQEVPNSFGTEMIRNGVRVKRGKFLTTMDLPETRMSIYDENGQLIQDRKIRPVNSLVGQEPAGLMPGTPEAGVENPAPPPSLALGNVSSISPPSNTPDDTKLTAMNLKLSGAKPDDEPVVLVNPIQNVHGGPYRFPPGFYMKSQQREISETAYKSDAGDVVKQSVKLLCACLLVSFLLAINYQ